jgi:hypothetical protein
MNYDNSVSEEITYKIREGNRAYNGYEGFVTSKLINKDIKRAVDMTLISR